jgi:hypothetical protein
MLIRTNTRNEAVKRQKQIIDYVDKHQDRHGTHPSMKEAMIDYGRISLSVGLTKADSVIKR